MSKKSIWEIMLVFKVNKNASLLQKKKKSLFFFLPSNLAIKIHLLKGNKWDFQGSNSNTYTYITMFLSTKLSLRKEKKLTL